VASARVDRVVSRLRALDGKVLIFSSDQVLRVLAARWVEASAELGRRLELDPACICVLGYNRDSADSVIELWNDARRKVR
jgi:broad specificity phosphatase PhoE